MNCLLACGPGESWYLLWWLGKGFFIPLGIILGLWLIRLVLNGIGNAMETHRVMESRRRHCGSCGRELSHLLSRCPSCGGTVGIRAARH